MQTLARTGFVALVALSVPAVLVAHLFHFGALAALVLGGAIWLSARSLPGGSRGVSLAGGGVAGLVMSVLLTGALVTAGLLGLFVAALSTVRFG